MFDSIKLGQIVSISKGKKHNLLKSKTESSKRYIQIDDLRNNLNLKYTDDKKGVLVTKDDVIIAWDGANAGTVGYNLEGFIGSTLAVLRNQNPKEYNPQYLALFLQSKFSYLRARTTGATIPHLHRKTLEKLKIPKLDINEQKKIANLLTQVEILIAKREESIELLDALLRSSFLDMFIKDVESKELQSLGQYIKYMTSGARGWAKYYSDSGALFLRIQNVKEAKLLLNDTIRVNPPNGAEGSRTEVQENDLLFSITADLGRTAVVPKGLEKAYINQHLALLRLDLDEVNPMYVAHFYLSHYGQHLLKRFNKGGVKAGLNFNDIKKMKIIIPPKSLQDKFATIVKQVESTKEQYQKSLDELRNLFGSLSQRAFRGELELQDIDSEKSKLTIKINGKEIVLDNKKVSALSTDSKLAEGVVRSHMENIYGVTNAIETMNMWKHKNERIQELQQAQVTDYQKAEQERFQQLAGFAKYDEQTQNFTKEYESLLNLPSHDTLIHQYSKKKVIESILNLTDLIHDELFDDIFWTDNYDKIKKLVYKLLDEGKLEQLFDENEKRVVLRKVEQ